MTFYKKTDPKPYNFLDEETGRLFSIGDIWVNEITQERWYYDYFIQDIKTWLK